MLAVILLAWTKNQKQRDDMHEFFLTIASSLNWQTQWAKMTSADVMNIQRKLSELSGVAIDGTVEAAQEQQMANEANIANMTYEEAREQFLAKFSTTLAGDFLESVGVPPVGETVGVGGSVGEKNNGSTHSTHATLSTTTASFTVAQLVASNSDIYVKPNSKRPGTASGDRFAKYQSARSVSEYLKLGGTKSDLANDLKKGIVTVKVKVWWWYKNERRLRYE